MSTVWWRRNRWGLILLVPALAAAMGVPMKDAYTQYWKGQQHEPVGAAPGGWVDFAGSRLRLEKLAVDSGLKDFLGEPLNLAGGAQAWRAELDFDRQAQDRLGSCKLYLETANGDIYTADPSELLDFDLPPSGCAPVDKTNAATYQMVAYFLLPAGARPAAVRVSIPTQLPAYARLTPP